MCFQLVKLDVSLVLFSLTGELSCCFSYVQKCLQRPGKLSGDPFTSPGFCLAFLLVANVGLLLIDRILHCIEKKKKRNRK